MNSKTFELVLGTRNREKQRELQDLLAPWPIIASSLVDYSNALTVDEAGETFCETARLKATLQARHLGRWVMGEDSGLSVDALDGAPGVYSSRFAGENARDDENNDKLVTSLQSVPAAQRTAFYTCHMTLSDPSGRALIDVEATCRGRIVLEPRGSAGFGYDPYFELTEYHLTFAELGDTVKSILSHRARALRAFLKQLKPVVLQTTADKLSVESG